MPQEISLLSYLFVDNYHYIIINSRTLNITLPNVYITSFVVFGESLIKVLSIERSNDVKTIIFYFHEIATHYQLIIRMN